MNEIKHEQKHVHLHFPHLFKKNKKKQRCSKDSVSVHGYPHFTQVLDWC